MKVDRLALGLGGAAAVTVGTVVAILVLGYVPLAEFPQLSESPADIPGTIAFSTFDRDRSCVMTVPASGGTPAEVYCRPCGPKTGHDYLQGA
ncbi:MAG: hypothetical protein R3343_02070 [Nitriliruptorales bacterium]|nr:hypothetical protein [Nitriliruptorales bacterium]